jgi:hypothetical protein
MNDVKLPVINIVLEPPLKVTDNEVRQLDEPCLLYLSVHSTLLQFITTNRTFY